ncbi:MAG: mannose-1-phosphate guanylyltransferase [bacterium]
MRVAVIMAGGSGERFWPLSRRERPKQLLRLTSERLTMLEETVEHIAPLIPPERIFVATSEILRGSISRALSRLPPENILAEPMKRNTAACLGLSAAHIMARFDDSATMAVLTADHRIGDVEEFRRVVDSALSFAESHPALVAIGVVPTRPETGYGYIELGDDMASETPAGPIYTARRFHEKPDLDTAKEFLASGHFLWNSGMFFWSVDTLLRGLRKYMPSLAAGVDRMYSALSWGGSEEASSVIRDVFRDLDDISIDYGLMEKADNVYVIRATFPWDDVGSWDALERAHPRDESGNVSFGEPLLIDARNCIVYNDGGAEARALAVMGMEDVVVVATEDAVLVCPKSRAQEVRTVVALLWERGWEKFT